MYVCVLYVVTRVEKVLMVLRDGRHLVGYLRSFDQYCTRSLVFHMTSKCSSASDDGRHGAYELS